MTASLTADKRQHTPGPWVVGNGGLIRVHPFGSPYPICGVHLRGVDGSQDERRIIAEANAALIAAAPEMLALIKETRCPGGGWNGMPERLEGIAEVKDCLAAGVCGCIYGDVVKKAEGR